MPRVPNPLIKKAEKLYRAGMKTPKISKKLDIPAGTVRRWKAEGDWDNERSECPEETSAKETSAQKESKKKASAQKTRGAPFGNKNAVGKIGGAPLGNSNNFKHGFYMSVLPQEAQEMIESRGEISEEERLLNDLNLYEYRERCLVEAIEKQKELESGLATERVTKSKDGVTTTEVSTLNNIKDLQRLLTATQRSYNRCIMALNELRERQRRQRQEDTEESKSEPNLGELNEEELRRLAAFDDEG